MEASCRSQAEHGLLDQAGLSRRRLMATPAKVNIAVISVMAMVVLMTEVCTRRIAARQPQLTIPCPTFPVLLIGDPLERFAARVSGLASGQALAVRPAGVAEAPALKGGSRRSFLRSG